MFAIAQEGLGGVLERRLVGVGKGECCATRGEKFGRCESDSRGGAGDSDLEILYVRMAQDQDTHHRL